MNKLHKRDNTNSKAFEPKEGERNLLCSNKGGIRSPSLDLGISEHSTREELIKVLAQIIVKAFLREYGNADKTIKQGSNLLPRINKRTS